jgi:hypothetical protein
MMVVKSGHLLCLAVENPIDRALGRHRLYPWLCERLLDGRRTTTSPALAKRTPQGHDGLCDGFGCFGRGGPRSSRELFGPVWIVSLVAVAPLIEPAF